MEEDDEATPRSNTTLDPSEDWEDPNSDEGLDDNELLAKIKEELLGCLDNVKTEGSVSYAAQTSSYPNPGLRVSNYGSIGLPLTSKDAVALANVCKQAPFGRKDQTLVDEKVRKTWELDAHQFECRNPAWLRYVESLTQNVVESLGVDGLARAEIYKLLLYEEGAFFKAHKDSEKVPGMFGSMVVCLPSLHEGGAVLLSHAGKSKRLLTAPTSEFNLTTLAWYSDVTHSVEEITKGHRLVLTYNLLQDPSHRKQTADLLLANRLCFAESLRRWTRSLPERDCLVYILEHKYTQASLKLSSLKGRDTPVGRYLQNVCSDNGYYYFFANMTASKSAVEEYDMSAEDDEICLKNVVAPDGMELASTINIEEDAILSEDPFDRGCDSEDEEEYTGNASMPSTHRYHDTVAIMMPKQSFTDNFLLYTAKKTVVDFVIADILAHPQGAAERQLGEQVLNIGLTAVARQSEAKSTTNGHYPSFSDPYSYHNHRNTSNIASTLKSLGELADLLPGNALGSRDILGNVSFDAKSKEVLEFVAQRISTDFQKEAGAPDTLFDNWLKGICVEIKTYAGLRQALETFSKIQEHLSDSQLQDGHTLKSCFCNWANAVLESKYSVIGTFSREDIDPTIELIPLCGSIFFEKIVPIMRIHADRKCLLDFLLKLCDRPLDLALIQSTCVSLLRGREEFICPRPTKLPPASRSRRQPQVSNTVDVYEWPDRDATNFVSLLRRLWTLHQRDLVLRCITALDSKVLTVPHTSQAFWARGFAGIVKYLTDLSILAKHSSDDNISSATKSILLATLKQANLWMALTRPVPPKDWSRLPVHSQSERSIEFTVNKTRRKHIETNLNTRFFDLETRRLNARTDILVIKKITKEFEENLEGWMARIGGYQDELRSLHDGYVACMLGAALHNRLVRLNPLPGTTEATSVPANAIPPQPLKPATLAWNRTPGTPPQVAGTKRKVVVIDLCDDE